MNAKTDGSVNSTTDAAANSPPIAIQDRLVVTMFLVVGCLLGAIILVDLLSGMFR